MAASGASVDSLHNHSGLFAQVPGHWHIVNLTEQLYAQSSYGILRDCGKKRVSELVQEFSG